MRKGESIMIYGCLRTDASGRKKKYNSCSTKSRPVSTKKFNWSGGRPPRGESAKVESKQTTECATTKPERKEYTGTLIKGISTMHKSNAVPVINDEQIKEHARMRR